jgi:hypothetical protein
MNAVDIGNFQAPMKYSFVGVMNDEGYPHMNLITTLEGHGEKTIAFGRNYAGNTKNLLVAKKDAGFMSLGMDMNFWTGKMRFREIQDEGELKEYYNNKPGSRYNTYFTYLDVYVNDLLGIEGPSRLDLAAIGPLVQSVIPQMPKLASRDTDVLNAVREGTDAAAAFRAAGGPIFPAVSEVITRKTTGKFICWQDEDGIPTFAPLFNAIPAGASHMAFSLAESAERIKAIAEGAKVTLHCIDLTTMHAVQLRGEYHTIPEGFGYIDVKQLYNPMPPRPAIVYPRQAYAAVREF